MYKQKQTEKKPPLLKMWSLVVIGTAVILIFTLTPWNIIPTSVTENVTVLAVIEQGCVGESQYGVSVVVPECNAKVGDTVSATFNVPSWKLNGYLEELDRRQNPMVDAWDRNVRGLGFSP
jgi:hypothetical protein